MKLVFLLVILFSVSAFAGDAGGGELLRKFSRTGRVDPHYAFTKECIFYQNGIVEIFTQLADGPTTQTVRRIHPHAVREIRSLVHFARNGEIVEELYPCDAGTFTLEGFIGSQQVELDMAVNCRSHRVNLTSVLPRLKLISTQVCGF